MKKCRKLLGILIAAAIVLSFSVPAFAGAEQAAYTVTVTDSNAEHTYQAYAIFNGTLSGKTLADIVWGQGITDAGKDALGTLYGIDAPREHAAEIAKALAQQQNTDEFMRTAAQHKSTVFTAGTYDSVSGTHTISGLKAGYYLILEASPVSGTHDANTAYILEVVENSTVSPKASVPTVTKKVRDRNDTAGTETDWQDSADYDFADPVPFRLQATLGSDLTDYTTYQLIFHDTLSPGLSYQPESIQVQVGSRSLTQNEYAVTIEGNKLTVTIDDVLALGAQAGTVVTVTYTAVLDPDHAVVGPAGNPNTVYLEFSNNPYADGTGRTPDDKVTVFTYKLQIDKTDGENPLKGAGFTLYKKTGDTWTQIGEEVSGTELTTFVWTGLDDGTYRLEETTVPAGYNRMPPLEFTITAEHDILSDDPKLTALTSSADSIQAQQEDGRLTGVLAGTVVNHQGSTLPETGGMGTTVFYVTGGFLALTAVVLLVTKKKMSSSR